MFRYLLSNKISTRIGLTTALPLAVLLLLLSFLVVEKSRESQAMTNLGKLAHLAPTISASIHELQKERGISAGHISSKENNFGKLL